MAQEVKLISANSMDKVSKEATKMVQEGWVVKGVTTAVVQKLCGSKLEAIIVLEK